MLLWARRQLSRHPGCVAEFVSDLQNLEDPPQPERTDERTRAQKTPATPGHPKGSQRSAGDAGRFGDPGRAPRKDATALRDLGGAPARAPETGPPRWCMVGFKDGRCLRSEGLLEHDLAGQSGFHATVLRQLRGRLREEGGEGLSVGREGESRERRARVLAKMCRVQGCGGAGGVSGALRCGALGPRGQGPRFRLRGPRRLRRERSESRARAEREQCSLRGAGEASGVVAAALDGALHRDFPCHRGLKQHLEFLSGP